ncbi:MAG: tetratricopeptide repeat protein [Pyrinomonadaceae bacterium]
MELGNQYIERTLLHKTLKAEFEEHLNKEAFIDKLNENAFWLRMRNQNFLNALEYAISATEFSRLIEYKKGLGWGLVNKVRCIIHSAHSTELDQYLKESSRIFAEIGDKGGEATSLIFFGRLKLQEKDFVTANDYFDRALKISRLAHNVQAEQLAYFFCAKLCNDLEDWESAIKYCNFALSIDGDFGMRVRIATLIGKAYLSLNNIHYARRTFEKALFDAKALHDKFSLANLQIQLGRVLIAEGKPEEAKAAILAGLDQANEIGLYDRSDLIVRAMLDSCLKISDFNSAISILERFLHNSTAAEKAAMDTAMLLKLASVHITAGNMKDAKRIISFLGKDMGEDVSDNIRLEFYKLSSEICFIEDNHKDALVNYRKFQELTERVEERSAEQKMKILQNRLKLENQLEMERVVREKDTEAARMLFEIHDTLGRLKTAEQALRELHENRKDLK